jgi:pilus assembly protein CpaE
MTKALEKADASDDEQGVAEAAARLGPDGGPMLPAKVEKKTPADFDDFDDAFSDDSWLEEDLSDEELAALDDEQDAGGDLAVTESASDDDFDMDFDDDEPIVGHDLRYLNEQEGASQSEAPTSGDDFFGPSPAAEAVKPKSGRGEVTNRKEQLPEDAELDAFEDENVEAGAPVEDDKDLRPVPRISIHAFCETTGISSLLEQAAADRRLAKTHVTIHMGGLSKAIDHFQSAATPNLVIVEALDGGPALFGQLGELAQVCDPSTKVIIIGRINDIALYRELIRQGVSEYLVKPRTPLQVIKSIASLYIDPSAPPIGKTICFVGARGGVGSSTIAHNVAWCVSEEHKSDTVILDLDLPFGTASLDFEQDPTSGLIEALTSPERLDDVLLDRLLQKHTDHLSLFTAPNLLDRDYDLDERAFETVVDVVRGAAPTIIIDMPHVWTAWSKRLLQTADEIVITACPDLASFRNTKNLVDVVAGARPNDNPPKLVLNQFDAKVSSVQSEQFVEHVGLTPSITIGWEPQLFHTAATNAAPIVQVAAKSKTAAQIRELAALVLGRGEASASKAKFSLAGLFKKPKK